MSDTDKELEDYPMKLDVDFYGRLISLITTSKNTADFEEGEIKTWLQDNKIRYEILILEDDNEVDIRFLDENGNENNDIETYFKLRWLDLKDE